MATRSEQAEATPRTDITAQVVVVFSKLSDGRTIVRNLEDQQDKKLEALVESFIQLFSSITNPDNQERVTKLCTREAFDEVACFDCGEPYDSPNWIEAVVPHEIWNTQISPTKSPAGLLCITCMAKRAVTAGLKDVPLKITAGPFVTN